MNLPVLKKLTLKNFRGFKKSIELPLAPLTFLVGPNSSGKSSISDSIMLIAQSGLVPNYHEASFTPQWIGRLVDLGSFEDTVHKHNRKLAIDVGFDISIDPDSGYAQFFEGGNKVINYEFSIREPRSGGSSYLRTLKIKDGLTGERLSIQITPGRVTEIKLFFNDKDVGGLKFRSLASIDVAYRHIYRAIERAMLLPGTVAHGKKAGWKRIQNHLRSRSCSWFMSSISRVSSGRSGPERWYVPQGNKRASRFSMEDSEAVFESLSPEMVNSSKEDSFPTKGSRNFFHRRSNFKPARLHDILKKLGIGDRIDVKNYTAYHSILQIRDHVINTSVNISDVGYGASQVIPVIAACTKFSTAPLIVEQPEIHLHPKAQGHIGDLLCETSKSRQVFVETHSVHLINRARILVAKGDISPEHISILYVSRDRTGSKVTHIPVKENGDFSKEWPEGFFDERYEETMRLIELKQGIDKKEPRG